METSILPQLCARIVSYVMLINMNNVAFIFYVYYINYTLMNAFEVRAWIVLIKLERLPVHFDLWMNFCESRS